MMNDDETLQVDFMDEVSGVRSFEGVRKRARQMEVGGAAVRVADLADIIDMKRGADRPRDRAVLEILEKTLEAITTSKKVKLKTLREQSEWLEKDMIRRRVAAPLEWRMNFLRRRVGICRSCL